jgi:antitoxin ParD1/3/4
MNVNLGPVFDQFVSELLATGLYQSQSEILREGLRLLKERQDFKTLQIARLRAEVALGANQADRGEFVDGPAAFAAIRRNGSSTRRANK